MRFLITTILLFLVLTISLSADILILDANQSAASAIFADELKLSLVQSGLACKTITWNNVFPTLLNAKNDTLVLTDSQYFIAQAVPALAKFIENGNKLLAISGIPFSQTLINHNDKWQRKTELLKSSFTSESTPLAEFTEEKLKIVRDSDTKIIQSTRDIVASNHKAFARAQYIRIPNMNTYETIGTTDINNTYITENDATIFWAKGGNHNHDLLVEIDEKDGSRWIKIIKIKTQWQKYILIPEDFKYFGTNGAIRGTNGDKLNPKNISYISFGFATTLTTHKNENIQEFWISDVYTAHNNFKNFESITNLPILESLSPNYKLYTTVCEELKYTYENKNVKRHTEIVSPISRPNGLTAPSEHPYRMLPLIYTYDKTGKKTGSAAHIFINNNGKREGQLWGHIGFNQHYISKNRNEIVNLATHMIRMMNTGIFIANAGTDKFGYSDTQNVKTAAFINNFGKTSPTLAIKMILTKPDGNKIVQKNDFTINSKSKKYIEGNTYNLPAGEYKIETFLYNKKRIIDYTSHDFSVIHLQERSPKDIVTVKGSDFYLNGKKWYPIGMNYWPSNTAALEPENFFNNHFVPYTYDPEIIERDFKTMKKLGMNCISIQYSKNIFAPSIIDLMARAYKYGFKVHCFTDGFDPTFGDQTFEYPNSLIKDAFLHYQPALFAYDLGWEVNIGRFEKRAKFDNIWQQWVLDRYGSIENAVRDWNYSPNITNEGFISGPTDEQLLKDGDHRIYIAAYRRFWDDELSLRYKAIHENIRSFDKSALLCARSGYGGTGQYVIADCFPYDMLSGIKHLDFTSPEAYGLHSNISNFMCGSLNTFYGNFVSGGKPVFWAEFGQSIYPLLDDDIKEYQRNYYECMLRMVRLSHANGAIGWWFPGGYRVDERSDYGITNPDGTLRPAANVFNMLHDILMQERSFPKPDTDCMFEYDRDKYVEGYAGFYMPNCQKFSDIMLAGKIPGIYTKGTGTNSANTPLIAVGNVACNGTNPPKFLNAEFNYININQYDSDPSLYSIDISIGNTGEAKWLSTQETGGVFVKMTINDKTELLKIENNTPYLSDATAQCKHVKLKKGDILTFRMTAKNRTDFGEVRRIVF